MKMIFIINYTGKTARRQYFFLFYIVEYHFSRTLPEIIIYAGMKIMNTGR